MPTKFPNPQENDSGSSMRHPLYDVPLPVLRMVRYWLLWMLAPNTANVGIFIVVLGVAGIMLTLERYWWSIGLLIFAGAWALASWLYNILKVKRRAEESDNDGPSKKHEAFMAIVIVIVATSVPVYYINQARIAHDVQRQKDEARKLLDERLDSYQHLTTTAYLAPTASPSLTLFTIRNGGKSWLSKYEISCGVPQIIYGHHKSGPVQLSGKTQTIATQIADIPPDGVVKTDQCLRVVNLGPALPIGCVDVIVYFDWRLKAQPDIPMHKEFRFVTHREADGLHWIDVGVASEESYCFDHVMQDPYGNISP